MTDIGFLLSSRWSLEDRHIVSLDEKVTFKPYVYIYMLRYILYAFYAAINIKYLFLSL